VDIGGAIAACGQLLIGHGGHPGAAGLSLLPENIDRFRRELDRQIALHRDEGAPIGLMIDAEAPLAQLSLALAEGLQILAPFGQGNPTPQFLARNLTVVEDRRIGREGTLRRLVVQGADGAKAPVIWFHGADAELPVGPLDLVYTLNINEYKGERSLQLGYVATRPAQVETIAVDAQATPLWQVQDWRGQEIPLAQLPVPAQSCWYAEGVRLESGSPQIPFAPRTNLQGVVKGQPLVLWSIPPSPEILHWLVDTVQPSSIHLCGQQSSDDSVDGLLRQLASMCKYALAHQELLNVGRMAARLGATEAIVRYGLLWLEQRGLIKIEEWDPSGAPVDSMRIAAGNGVRQTENANQLRLDLAEQLAEVRAYRRFFLRAKISELGLHPAK
jgi:single-stranded-DNA-specific exonuclease